MKIKIEVLKYLTNVLFERQLIIITLLIKLIILIEHFILDNNKNRLKTVEKKIIKGKR